MGELATRAHLSERQVTRRFRDVTGESPYDWLVGQRIAASLALLEGGDDSSIRSPPPSASEQR